MDYPSDSPDLSPCDYFLFPKLKTAMKGAFYDDVPTIQSAVTQVLKNIPKTEFKKSMDNLILYPNSSVIFGTHCLFGKRSVRLSLYVHTLQIEKNQPFIRRCYPISMAYREKVEEEMHKMLSMGIIQRSNSRYINPIVPVIKKDGTVRLCLHARKLNEILLED